MDNFADMPKSVAELRAAKQHDGSQWTPRDVLIEVLRRIDKGEIQPERLLIIFREVIGKEYATEMVMAAPGDRDATIGCLARAQRLLLDIDLCP